MYGGFEPRSPRLRPTAVNRPSSLLVTTALLMTGATACGAGGTHTDPPRVAVSGVLRMTGGPSGASQPGAPGEVTFTSSALAATATAGPDGTFRLQLPPGTYTATGTSPQYGDSQGICRADQPVVVGAHGTAGLVVACSRA
ncbi:MAG: hypothetical protein JWN67_5319 [Actinomycetia bacterium]|nr:hypothetical protein [Actinomycetes bacterium]